MNQANPLEALVVEASNELTKNNGSCGSSSLWDRRSLEPGYAVLKDLMSEDTNRYGQKIDLLEETNGKLPAGRSLYINENPAVGDNPNRNKQHGFYFNADNCIGCHACEAACSEKNENPAHIAFRSVGYVEGGSFPDFQRMNISMACNHCDDPVCLKGCPTKAYTKHAEYGAVLQDPDTCFGCGYCTWVCPYNAPQLDPVEGQVSKCNMCVDRLEVGLKPSCVAACVGNALDFGVVENIPENREQAKVSIPGFPDPDITHPNIRFQQTKTLPDEMQRTDTMPVKYRKNEAGDFEPAVDRKQGTKKYWNLQRLSSRENPLVLFTLLTQMGIGAFSFALIASFVTPAFAQFKASATYVPFVAVCCAAIMLGLFMSTIHLGKPLRFYRGFNNLRWSPVSREGLGVAMFMTFAGVHLLLSVPANPWVQSVIPSLAMLADSPALSTVSTGVALLAIASGWVGLYYMVKCYRIKARPFWNHWQTATSFIGNSLSFGALLVVGIATANAVFNNLDMAPILQLGGGVILLGLLLEGTGLIAHAGSMRSAAHEGAASFYIQETTFGKTYLLRNTMLLINVVMLAMLLFFQFGGALEIGLWGMCACLLLLVGVIGRALFYILVVPTTMPGAFFWKNKGFEEHAKDIGLAASMPSAGIVDSSH